MAKNRKNPPKESINIKEFRPKIGIYLPVIRCDVAMVTAKIQKLTPKKKPYYIGTHIGKSLQGKLREISYVSFFNSCPVVRIFANTLGEPQVTNFNEFR